MRIYLILLFLFLFLNACSTSNPVYRTGLDSNQSTSSYAHSTNANPSSVSIDAESWVSCKVQPIGSIIKSTQNHSLTTFWKTAYPYSNQNGCINGLASGEGFVRWCESSALCVGSSDSFYGSASGKLDMGRFVEQDGKILVTLNSKRGLFQGEITTAGSYKIGSLKQLDRNEKFVGLLDTDGHYQSGALYKDNKIILANEFSGTEPLGRVLTGDANGNFIESECDSVNHCRIINQNRNNLISELFQIVAGNKAQEIGLRNVLRMIGQEAFLMHPALRALDFLGMAVDILALTEKTIPTEY